MKICVLGVGRSGTKAIYTLLQSIMSEYHEQVEFIYEPFLWDKDTFNGHFEDVKGRFGTMDAISHEGIHNHLSLPLLINNKDSLPENGFLRRLLIPSEPGRNILIKFIRANGRIRLLQNICPELKIIFIIRNPLDTVNSILNRFSFFGGEFHRDDFSRFLTETECTYGKLAVNTKGMTLIERELLFWYYMNLFALETIGNGNTNALTLCHETYLSQTENQILRICNFLGYKYQERYTLQANVKVGVINEKFTIARQEYEHALKYVLSYPELLKKFGIDCEFDLDPILSKYNVSNDTPVRSRLFYGFTPLRILREIKKQSSELPDLKP